MHRSKDADSEILAELGRLCEEIDALVEREGAKLRAWAKQAAKPAVGAPRSSERQPPRTAATDLDPDAVIERERTTIEAAAMALARVLQRPQSNVRELLEAEIAKEMKAGLAFASAVEAAKRTVASEIWGLLA